MDGRDFIRIRKKLGKTQVQLAQLLCVSPKAIQSFEQGWRQVPVHIERQILVLLSCSVSNDRNIQPCWETKNCPVERRNNCVVWDLQVRHFCWFVSGTNCQGKTQKNWNEKLELCRDCEVFQSLLGKHL